MTIMPMRCARARLRLLKEGKRVALISDAGMPLISDPGYKLVAQCAVENIPMTCIPGPTATTTALGIVGPADGQIYVCRVFCRPSQRHAGRRWRKSKPCSAYADFL